MQSDSDSDSDSEGDNFKLHAGFYFYQRGVGGNRDSCIALGLES